MNNAYRSLFEKIKDSTILVIIIFIVSLIIGLYVGIQDWPLGYSWVLGLILSIIVALFVIVMCLDDGEWSYIVAAPVGTFASVYVGLFVMNIVTLILFSMFYQPGSIDPFLEDWQRILKFVLVSSPGAVAGFLTGLFTGVFIGRFFVWVEDKVGS